MEQIVLTDYQQLKNFITGAAIKRLFLVCGRSADKLAVTRVLMELESAGSIQIMRFSEFSPNPSYQSVEKAVALFRCKRCDAIIAIGGGSAIDVAKCIKLYCHMDEGQSYLHQEIIPNSVPLLAVPTTAGSGSEATRYAVIYENGIKRSVAHSCAIPTAVLLDALTLHTLSLYQRKATMLDALCHGLESSWSIHANQESMDYARRAIALIMSNADAYLRNDPIGNQNMLTAANLAGRAINITQTTAGHAMCYQLTKLYGIAHGHAVALCVARLWPYMVKHKERCTALERDNLEAGFAQIAEAMACQSIDGAVAKYHELLGGLGLKTPVPTEKEYAILKNSVNPERLKNNPIRLNTEEIDLLYHQIFTPRLAY